MPASSGWSEVLVADADEAPPLVVESKSRSEFPTPSISVTLRPDGDLDLLCFCGVAARLGQPFKPPVTSRAIIDYKCAGCGTVVTGSMNDGQGEGAQIEVSRTARVVSPRTAGLSSEVVDNAEIRWEDIAGSDAQAVRAIKAEQEQIRVDQDALSRKRYELAEQLRAVVAKSLGKFPWEIEIGSWDCPPRREEHFSKESERWFDEHFPPARLAEIREANPNGLCVYGPTKDPCRDHCLFCGNPEERK